MSTPTVLLASGSNARGQLANGTTDDSHTFAPCNFLGCLPGDLPPNTRQIVHIASGSNHAIALLERQHNDVGVRKELWGCGDGSRGQLGPSYMIDVEQKCDPSSRSVFRPLDLPLQNYGLNGYDCRLVASAWETSYVVLSSDGRGDVVLSMGVDDFGDLGVGESRKGKDAVKPLNVVNFSHIVFRGTHLDDRSLAVESLSAGPHHVIIHTRCPSISIVAADEILTIGWGTSRHGQLGQVSKSPRTALSAMPRLIAGESIPYQNRIVSSSLGNQHSVFLHASGHITCLGSNKKGQLRDITTLRNVQSVNCTWNSTYAVVRSGDDRHTIFATGSHAKGQLGRITPSAESESIILPLAPVYFPFASSSHRLERMASGSEHILALFRNTLDDPGTAAEVETEVWGWGWNEHGNLGVGTTDDIKLPARIWPGARGGAGRVVGIWAGCGTSWIAFERWD
jgi:protein ATS1